MQDSYNERMEAQRHRVMAKFLGGAIFCSRETCRPSTPISWILRAAEAEYTQARGAAVMRWVIEAMQREFVLSREGDPSEPIGAIGKKVLYEISREESLELMERVYKGLRERLGKESRK